MRGDGLANIGKCFAPPQIAGWQAGAGDQHKNLFSGVVCGLESWIIAMVGGEDHHVSLAQSGGHFRQTAVKLFKTMGIARNIAAVAIVLVEINEIGEDKIPVRRIIHRLQGGINHRIIAIGLADVGDAAVGEDIGDLADGKYPPIVGLNPVEQGW